MSDDILSVVYLLLVLALVLPGFIYMNKNKKIFLKNLFLWVVMVGIVMLGYLYQK
jgi:magnesium-transporting ATPase (P-type)